MAQCDLENNGYTFLWEIENYSMHALAKRCCFQSPTFVNSILNKSQWRLKLYPFETLEGNLGVEIEKVDGNSETNVEVSFYLLTSKGPKHLKTVEQRKYVTKDTFIFYIEENTLEGIFSDSSVYFANDTLKLKCHMKNNAEPPHLPVICSALTRIEVENHVFDHSFTCMNCFPIYLYEKIILPRSKTMPRIKIQINRDPILDEVCRPSISFEILEADRSKRYKLKIAFSLCDNKDNVIRILQNSSETLLYPEKKGMRFFLSIGNFKISASSWMTLTMHFNLSISSSQIHSSIYDCDNASTIECNAVNKLSRKEINNSKQAEMTLTKTEIPKPSQIGLDSLLDDLNLLLTEKKCCDVTIKTNGKEFLAHKNILSIRSPVFCTMFESAMKEKKTGIVNIDDIDPQTFKLFLSYLYLGRLDGLTEENAVALYSAADKYQVMSLKNECSAFILDHLHAKNVCDVLILSEMYQDNVLKKAAQKIFCVHSKTVLLSKEWESLFENKPKLAAATLHEMALNM